MDNLEYSFDVREDLVGEIAALLQDLGKGKIHGVAYDTAWIARLAPRYPGYEFEDSIDWLRHNQHEDGTWGASQLQYHDRFVSTLAAMIALRETGTTARDERLVRCGENALWKLATHLGRDASDTVGFPIISTSLAQDAAELGLDVPRFPIRYGTAYRRKVQALLAQSNRDWRFNVISFSFEGLWRDIGEEDQVLEANHSVASSPAATAAYLLNYPHEGALEYLRSVREPDGSIPAFAPNDIFEIAWALNHLREIGAVHPDIPAVKQALDHVWARWSPVTGAHYSSYFQVPDLDITAACFSILRWGGYPVEADIFEYFEMDDHFCNYRYETNPSATAHLRLLIALQDCPEHPKHGVWMEKVLTALQRFNEQDALWSDKWHTSPYYVSNLAIRALHELNTELAASYMRWILKTQNPDGGWGHGGHSTPEETAYCIDSLLLWNRTVEAVDPETIEKGVNFLRVHNDIQHYTSLWISKVLYTPHNIVKSVILSALFQYTEWR